MSPNRWSNDVPRQGSAFHELVTLPTLAPHLAQPYQVPGLNDIMPTSVAIKEHDVPSLTEAASGLVETDVPQTQVKVLRQFDLSVTVEWLERAKGLCPSTKGKKAEETKPTHQPHVIAGHNLYTPGVVNGPAFKIYWAGSIGGKTRALTIHDNAEWDCILVKLGGAKAAVDTVSVVFDLDTMGGYKNRKQPASPTDADEELAFGTHVPRADMYTAEQSALAESMTAIKAAWNCDEHGTCFIDGKCDHIEVNRFRLKAWASTIPVAVLHLTHHLQNFFPSGSVSRLMCPATKPHGCLGPNAMLVTADAATPAADHTGLLLQTLSSAFNMFASAQPSAASSSLAIHTAANTQHQSSPPPTIEAELDVLPLCLCHCAGIASSERLKEITGLMEGQVLALKKFAKQWCGKIDAKRARRVM
ncbi:hypothetical protein EV702DRAFT_1192190 [Suillus placidus]|uniref:Uncharacterized protein n=1 Tax=Suillus placidus TaxID=48579 RepID=A0A9P7D6Y1_9AGAM|nr:hypothetical protein EV702DRAFT_1192190 [Suillus placidus]